MYARQAIDLGWLFSGVDVGVITVTMRKQYI